MLFILNRVLYILNILLALGLLCSYLAPYINPGWLWPFAFLGLAYPVLFALNLILLLYWLVQGKLKFLLSLFCLMVGFAYFPRIIKLSGKVTEDMSGAIKVGSFNAKGFNVQSKSPFFDTVNSYLKTQNYDILCMQEFFNSPPKKESKADPVKALLKSTSLRHYAFNAPGLAKEGFGTVIFSRFPIVHKGNIDFGDESFNSAVYADVKISEDTIRVYCLHLQSNKLERKSIPSAKDIEHQEEAVRKSKNILRRLKYGFEQRAKQVEMIREHMDSSPHRVIVAGDFNDTQLSYTYHILCDNLKDAFVESGKGLGNTYVGPFPSYRIDYILFDEDFSGFNYKSGPHFGSDHKLIETLIKYKN